MFYQNIFSFSVPEAEVHNNPHHHLVRTQNPELDSDHCLFLKRRGYGAAPPPYLGFALPKGKLTYEGSPTYGVILPRCSPTCVLALHSREEATYGVAHT